MTSRPNQTRNKVTEICAAICFALFPCLPLFFVQRHFPTVDWENHTWLINYYREFLVQHGSFPEVVHTQDALGLPHPIFYGVHFYRLLAIFSLPFGPTDWGLRLFLLLLTFGKLGLIRSLLRKCLPRPWLASSIGALAVWEIYAMTNMYNRAAVTEYAATSLLLCAALVFLLGCDATRRAPFIVGGAILTALSAGSHPTMGVLGTAAMIFIITVVGVPSPAIRRYAFVFASVMLGSQLVSLAPWIHAVARFHSFLQVAHPEHPNYIIVPEIHQVWLRMLPFPFDPRTSGKSFQEIARLSTPYLDAQINVAVLVLVLAVAFIWFKQRKALPAAAVLMLAGSLALLICSASYRVWPQAALSAIQYPYRLVGLCNVLLVVSFAMLVMHLSPSERLGKRFNVLVVICLCISGIGIAMKIPRSLQVTSPLRQLQPYEWETNAARMLVVPEFFYGVKDYATPALYQPPSIVVSTNLRVLEPRVDARPNWGRPLPLSSTHERHEKVMVTALAFPWNVLYVDGQRFDAANTEVAFSFPLLDYAPGTHTTNYRFEPPAAWRVLKTVSDIFFVLLVCSFPALCWRNFKRKTQ